MAKGTGLTEREIAVLARMNANTPMDSDAAFYTDQIGTSARLLAGLERRGFVRRHDPSKNFYAKAGSEPIRWSLSRSGRVAGRAALAERGGAE